MTKNAARLARENNPSESIPERLKKLKREGARGYAPKLSVSCAHFCEYLSKYEMDMYIHTINVPIKFLNDDAKEFLHRVNLKVLEWAEKQGVLDESN